MINKPFLTTGIICLVAFGGFRIVRSDDIPKTWDIAKLKSMHLPLPDSSITVNPVSEDFYYNTPVRTPYRSYPLYMPGREPAGYFEWLKQQDPEVVLDTDQLKTEADWIRAGEIIYDMPQAYQVIDSSFKLLLPALGRIWQGFQLQTTPTGEIPFVSIVIREKGRLELATQSCGMCHTKIMPDGSLLKGGQGNFVFSKFIASLLTAQKEVHKTPDSMLNRRIRASTRLLFEAPWIKHESQDRISEQQIDTWLESLGTAHGVLHRQGTALGFPVNVPDLFHLKERKYFDRTGEMQHRDISDLMRYAALNQSMDLLHDYNGFTPTPRPADPMKGNITRFSDTQLYALSKFIYSLEPPKNPKPASEKLVRKGQEIFTQQGCVTCHTPPYYSNKKLTPADGFNVPEDHFEKYDIFDRSVGTDPVLTLYSRRGTGYYKVPSLIGVWNRTAFLHGGNLANLEDMFDPNRLKDDYVPTGYKPPWKQRMAVPGHPFGMELRTDEKKALVAFLRSL